MREQNAGFGEQRSAGAIEQFAERLRDNLSATRVLLFGSHARGTASAGSDYDVIVVSPAFEGVRALYRGLDLWYLWYEVGGSGPIDIVCLTPAEFEEARGRLSFIATILPEAVDLLPDVASSS